MTQKIIYIFLFLNTILLSRCAFDPPSKSMLDIYNYTDDAIYVYYTAEESIQLKPSLEVFFINHFVTIDKYGNRQDTIGYYDYRIDSHSYTSFKDDGVHSIGKFRPFPNKDYVNFFFIKETIMRTHTWEEIVEKQMYERKVRYTYKQLDQLHYQILFKP